VLHTFWAKLGAVLSEVFFFFFFFFFFITLKPRVE